MREFVFTLTYEPGRNAVADTLAEHPEARIRSLSLQVTERSLWRVDHASGTPESLAAIEETFLTADYYADCLATEDCGASQTTNVLEHTDETLVLYSYWKRTPTCASVPHIALDHLGDGAVFETRHRGREYRWRVIHPEEGDVRAFVDGLHTVVGDCATMELKRLTDATAPRTSPGVGDLPANQEATLRAAVEHGYYETPRAVDLGDLADVLDAPRSTVAYRLRRAEAHLAERWIETTRPPDGTLPML